MTLVSPQISPLVEGYEDALGAAISQRPQVESFVEQAVERGLRDVFLVGSGGSLASLYPAQYLLETRAPFATFIQTSGEFNVRRPARLGPESLVITASHRGQTPETVEAAQLARGAGATVVAVTRDPDSPLAGAADVAFTYGSDAVVTDAKHALLGILAAQLVLRTGGAIDYPALASAIDALPAALSEAIRERHEANTAIAERLSGEAIVYVLASGPSYGTAYMFAMCYLQESQWMHSAAYNAAEFFHGAFEVVDENVPVIVLLDEADTRPLVERALSFVQRYSRKGVAIDSRELTLPGVDPTARPLVSPIALGAVMARLGAHFAAVTGHGFDDRRYMFKVDY